MFIVYVLKKKNHKHRMIMKIQMQLTIVKKLKQFYNKQDKISSV